MSRKIFDQPEYSLLFSVKYNDMILNPRFAWLFQEKELNVEKPIARKKEFNR